MNPKVDWFFSKDTKWRAEYGVLRSIVAECGLTEELKWGCPCYTIEGRNVVLIHGFKEYCALLFMKGALLNDPGNILVQQTANVQSARQIRFTQMEEIVSMESTLKAYIRQAVEIEKGGMKVEVKKTADFTMPDEFRIVLEDMPGLKAAFYKLTPGRQRGYLLHFSAPKRAATREARIEKYTEKILNGKGLDD